MLGPQSIVSGASAAIIPSNRLKLCLVGMAVGAGHWEHWALVTHEPGCPHRHRPGVRGAPPETDQQHLHCIKCDEIVNGIDYFNNTFLALMEFKV